MRSRSLSNTGRKKSFNFVQCLKLRVRFSQGSTYNKSGVTNNNKQQGNSAAYSLSSSAEDEPMKMWLHKKEL